jgi:hypothetical protein
MQDNKTTSGGPTSEQLAKLKTLGTNLKGSFTTPTPQQTQRQQVPQQEKQAVSEPVTPQQQVAEIQHSPIIEADNEEKETYLKLVSKEDEQVISALEIDLKTYRERGEEVRYVSILFSGFDSREDPPKPQEAFFNITSKEDFEFIKNFFSKLNWED